MSENHAQEHIGSVYCEWCDKYVSVNDYNTNHGPIPCNESESA
jgi:hypothetical protein